MTYEDKENPEPRAVIGWLDCPYCDAGAPAAMVKRNVKGKPYVVCAVHGIAHLNNKAGQDWILARMRDTPERTALDPEPELPPAEAMDESSAKPPKKKRAMGALEGW